MRLSMKEIAQFASDRIVAQLIDLWERQEYKAVRDTLLAVNQEVAGEWKRQIGDAIADTAKRDAFFNYMNFVTAVAAKRVEA